MKTKLATLAAMLALATMSVGVEAKGCLKGALIGGVGRHVAGHHGVAGAAAGCAAGHYLAKKKAAKQQAELENRAITTTAPTTQTVARKN